MQLRQPLIASVFQRFYDRDVVGISLSKGNGWAVFRLSGLVVILLGNFVLIVYYQYRFVFPFSWDNVFPSWSVLFVGIAMAALTSPASKQFLLGQVVFGYACL